jgi:hypothetical protein
MAGELPLLSDAHGGWWSEPELASSLGISPLGLVGVLGCGIKLSPPELTVAVGLAGPRSILSPVASIWSPLPLGGFSAGGGHCGGRSSLLLPASVVGEGEDASVFSPLVLLCSCFSPSCRPAVAARGSR